MISLLDVPECQPVSMMTMVGTISMIWLVDYLKSNSIYDNIYILFVAGTIYYKFIPLNANSHNKLE